MPSRMPNNNLHLYSKVLDSQQNGNKKLDIPMCPKLTWETPIYLNVTASLQSLRSVASHSSETQPPEQIAANIRRKLESQKGEVRVVSILI